MQLSNKQGNTRHRHRQRQERSVSKPSTMASRDNPPDTRDLPPAHDAPTADLRPLINSSLLSWKTVCRLLQGETCIIDGSSLDIASVVAVAKSVLCSILFQTTFVLTVIFRYGTSVKLSTDDDVTRRIDDSVRMLRSHLDQGHVVYGKSY